MVESVDEKIRIGMKITYLDSLGKMLEYEQHISGIDPPEVIGFKSKLGRRLLGRAVFGLYQELCSIGERKEAELTIAKYRQGKTLVPSLS
ncbi:MAG: hypothetical protein HY051_03730 [Candidatus Aenigmarchaeota archaeon]|nr:hypothetical protein [Candidatus Aenigmarchaeota archaeon]